MVMPFVVLSVPSLMPVTVNWADVWFTGIVIDCGTTASPGLLLVRFTVSGTVLSPPVRVRVAVVVFPPATVEFARLRDSVGPTLSLNLANSTVAGGNTTTATLTRTGGDNTVPLTVNLTSSNPGEAVVPQSITIPVNQTSAQFTVTGINDGTLNTTKGITIDASASGYADGAVGLTISNANQPDLAVSNIIFPPSIV